MKNPCQTFLQYKDVIPSFRTAYSGYTLLLLPVLLVLFAMLATSCREPVSDRLDRAEALVAQRPDSAAMILGGMDYFWLDEDAKARYIVTKAQANLLSYHSLVTDSLLPVAVGHYRHTGDTLNWLKANILYAHYLSNMNRTEESVEMLDDVIAAIPADSIDHQYELRSLRMRMAMLSSRYKDAIAEAEWLMYHTVFPKAKFLRAYDKMGMLFFDGRKNEATAWGDSIINSDFMPDPGTEEWNDFMGDYAEMLDECGESQRAIDIVEDILQRNPGFISEAKVGFLVSLAKCNANLGNYHKAISYLDSVDALDYDKNMIDVNEDEYLSFLRNAINFKVGGHLSALPDKRLKKELRRQEQVNYDAVAEMNRLSAWKMQLTLEKKNIAIISLSICLALVIIASVLFWMLRRRRARLLAAQDRIDTLDEMLRQVRDSKDDSKNAVLKKMVLQQMGILKTFASAPTAQSQEALKKISSTGSDTVSDRLVDWDMFYNMVDELYDGFHSHLVRRYPDLFTEKEVQIICLMKAEFSTKEIGFLTEQSSATIYVRKSAIRKKLNAQEGGDIITALEGRDD